MRRHYPEHQSNYRIGVKETIESRLAGWSNDYSLSPHQTGGTIITGYFVDQPALRGFLQQLWNLNFTVISVERIENES